MRFCRAFWTTTSLPTDRRAERASARATLAPEADKFGGMQPRFFLVGGGDFGWPTERRAGPKGQGGGPRVSAGGARRSTRGARACRGRSDQISASVRAAQTMPTTIETMPATFVMAGAICGKRPARESIGPAKAARPTMPTIVPKA